MNYILLKQAINLVDTVFSFLFSILAPLLLMWVGIVTVVDFFFLCIPTAQRLMEKKFYSSDGTKEGFSLVSSEARVARDEALKNGTNAMLEYLKRRVKTYFIVALLVYALAGLLPNLLSFILKYMASILDVFGGF